MTRCLLVDDDPEIRVLLLDYLTRFGLQAEAVPTARQCVRACRRAASTCCCST